MNILIKWILMNWIMLKIYLVIINFVKYYYLILSHLYITCETVISMKGENEIIKINNG
jgi:hypothetical protein